MNMLERLNTIEGWFSFSEGFLLYNLSKNSKGKGEVVEIGSWKGKSTAFLTQGVKDGNKKIKVTAIDPHDGILFSNKTKKKEPPTFVDFKNNLKKFKLLSYAHPLVTTSRNANKKWNKHIEILFIDGLHDYKNTYADFSLWSQFVIDGGIIAFHDAFCGHIGPGRVILEKILPSNAWSDIGVVGSIVYIQKGKVQSLLSKPNMLRHRMLIPLSAKFQKSKLPKFIKFFLIHRVIKFLLMNKYTFSIHLYK